MTPTCSVSGEDDVGAEEEWYPGEEEEEEEEDEYPYSVDEEGAEDVQEAPDSQGQSFFPESLTPI